MQPSVSSPAPRRQNIETAKPAFSVVAIHDGFFSGIRAMEALEWLQLALGSDLRLCPVSLSFDKLEKMDVRTMSVRAAAAADLLIVSASDHSPLPEHIKQWFDSIADLPRETRPILVVLHEEDSELNTLQGPLCTQMKEVASRWKTEFMCNEDFDQRLDRDFAMQLISRKNPGALHRMKPFGGEFQSPPRYWGING